MHMGPDIWGPHLWKAIHMISIGYPREPSEEQRKNYKIFFESLYTVIPCSVCSNNYKRHIQENPITNATMKDKQSLAKWLIDIHNMVNQEQNKKIYSHDESLLNIFNNFNNENSNIIDNKIEKTKTIIEYKENNFPIYILLFILIILVTIAVLYKKY